jgi:hypothetical protein
VLLGNLHLLYAAANVPHMAKNRALSVLLEEVDCARRAIEFVGAHDKELWYRLIDYSLRNERFLGGLLDHAGVGACALDVARQLYLLIRPCYSTSLIPARRLLPAQERFLVDLAGLICGAPSAGTAVSM